MKDTVSVNSTMIHRMEYDTENKTLSVEFPGGAIYDYMLVPEVLWEGLKREAADKDSGNIHASVGRYFNTNVKSAYQGIKVS